MRDGLVNNLVSNTTHERVKPFENQRGKCLVCNLLNTTFSNMNPKDRNAIKKKMMGSGLHTCNPLSRRETTPVSFQAFNLLSSTSVDFRGICFNDVELLGGEVFLLAGDALLTGNCSHETYGHYYQNKRLLKP